MLQYPLAVKRFLYSAILFFVFTSTSYSQVEVDTSKFHLSGYKYNSASAIFDKQLNTYFFNYRVKYFLEKNDFFTGIKENFTSTITKTSEKNIKDEQYLSAIGEYKFSDIFRAGVLIDNTLYSDDRKTAINKASQINLSGYTKIKFNSNISLTPYLGLSKNKQISEDDSGLLYGAEGFIEQLSLNDFIINSSARFQNEDISPRKNALRVINTEINNQFDSQFSNKLLAGYSEQRKDFYFAADPTTSEEFGINNNIQSRTESNYLIQEKLNYISPDDNLLFDLLGRVYWRDIDRTTRFISLNNSNVNLDNKINEFRLEFAGNISFISEILQANLRASYTEREEKHEPKRIDGISDFSFNEKSIQEAQKNNFSQLSTITFLGKINLTRKDLLITSVFHRKLRYDTPSEINFDDRDELLTIARIQYERKINAIFTAFINTEASLNKTVYIFKERSSNNNINRIIKLSGGGIFKTDRFESKNNAEVSANYTVYEFEELSPNFKSYSFRQLALRDSSQLHISRRMKLTGTGYLKFSEQGDFNWDDFKSRPIRYLSEAFSEIKLYYTYNMISLGAGIRYFNLSTYGYDNDSNKKLLSRYESIGPVSDITIALNSVSLSFYGWYEFIKTENAVNRNMANMNLKATIAF